ncbi:KIN14B-interacting protein At4g14310 [Typha latifolia]|uniref:KIN14B-interacting protein At4g14310 n=1 Tax=Typha latifolia TaxID=4733 RepID=UPI003C2AAD33
MSSKLKERGGGGGKIMASKSHRPLPESTPKEKGITARRTPIGSGKENARLLSCGKISAGRLNPVPKLADKPDAAPGGVRWSTSSMPRGKAPNPSDFSKLISGLRGDQLARVSGADRMARIVGKDLHADANVRRSVTGIRGLEKCQQRKGVLDSNCKEKDGKLVNSAKVFQRSKANVSMGKLAAKAVKVTSASEISGKKEDFYSKLLAVDAEEGDGITEGHDDKKDSNGVNSLAIAKEKVFLVPCSASSNGRCAEVSNHVKDGSGAYGKTKEVVDVAVDHKKIDLLASHSDGSNNAAPARGGSRGEIGEKISDKIKVFERANEEAKGVAIINKGSSKLHEKLAMLEGKVQKIASEIKRTKELLDNNNPDESKLILSDIQNKISGIEKAVGHVMDGTKVHLGLSEIKETDKGMNVETVLLGKPGDLMKSSARDMNNEELEARFFPHHKLLRNRRPSGSAGEQQLDTLKYDGDRGVEDGSVDENPIALEFLASLNEEQAAAGKCGRILTSTYASVLERGAEKTSVAAKCGSTDQIGGYSKGEVELLATEKLEEFDEQENRAAMTVKEVSEEICEEQLHEIGRKTSTGGWFVSEGEAVLLAHDDGSCSYYDIANYEIKAEYKPPTGVSTNLWGDCWLIRAPGADGCSGRYVVAASAGNTLDSGFCSWDFYTRDVKAFHVEDESSNCSSTSSSRMVLGPLPDAGLLRRSASCVMPVVERQQWWYRPCGPLLVSTASGQKVVTAYDIRDGEQVMKWEVNSPVAGMEYSSPIQWRSRGKMIIARTDAISLWDVNSVNPQPLVSVASAGKRVYSLHVNNTDAELGGGVRQRVSSSEVEGNDGVFCTQESVNVLDFRLPTGVGVKLSRQGAIPHSIFSRGDSIYIGSTEGRLPIKGGPNSRVQHYSLRKGKLVTTYELPESNTHFHHSCVTQVWGNSNLVMGICGMGLFVFDAKKDEGSQALCVDRGSTVGVKESIGPDDLYCPTFDYLGSRVLVVSGDRPAFWRYLF